MASKPVQQYLSKYAESEVAFSQNLFHPLLHDDEALFDACIVIPCFAEEQDCINRWLKLEFSHNCLLILVINQHENTQANQSALNQELWQYLSGQSQLLAQHENLKLLEINRRRILLVDRFSQQNILSSKQAVGQARKIGCDIATRLIVDGIVRSPWVYSTDADAFLPDNYIKDSRYETQDFAAQVFEFQHTRDGSATALATLQYEKAIKYYRDALAWAQSPYAFYTLGSTLAVHYEAYCQVRGFPKRAGAEDFYLLNKLAKVGKIQNNSQVCVTLQARVSDRVPFGTGPAVSKILEMQQQGKHYHYYHPRNFYCLKILLLSINESFGNLVLLSMDTKKIINTVLTELSDKHLNKQSIKHVTEEVRLIQDALHSVNIQSFIQHAHNQCKSASGVVNSFHQWCDAFITLKLIHFWQEHAYPQQNLDYCLQQFEQLTNS